MPLIRPKFIALIRQIPGFILNLVYPPVCPICEQPLSADEDQLCLHCLENFRLIGRPHEKFSVPGEIFISRAWALFEFDSAFQKLIHQLK